LKILLKLNGALSLLFILLVVFSFEEPCVAVLTILAGIIHELGHTLPCLYLKGLVPKAPKGQLDGFRIFHHENISYHNELIIISSGPLLNLALALILYLFFGTSNEYVSLFALINLMTCISNLMPIRQYDGYKIVSALIMIKSENPFGKIRILNAVSFFLTILISFLSLYLILKLCTGFWIFGLLFFELLKSILEYNKA
jgi:Zn-dependent protease